LENNLKEEGKIAGGRGERMEGWNDGRMEWWNGGMMEG
jgi:hypothetical protein